MISTTTQNEKLMKLFVYYGFLPQFQFFSYLCGWIRNKKTM